MPQTATAIRAENSKTTGHVLAAASHVAHKMGPGFAERFYLRALAYELELLGIPTEIKTPSEVTDKDSVAGESAHNLIVNGEVLVEVKCVKGLTLEHLDQCLSDLKATGLRIGLLLNFQARKLDWARLDL